MADVNRVNAPAGAPADEARHNTSRLVPLIVASALIMQQIDTTAVSTALPAMAKSLGRLPVDLHGTITTYMLALGVFLPSSGWLADRWGARRVFCLAVALFTLSSLTCALSVTVPMLTLSRFIQGIGGAMMLPTARLILVRSVDRRELVAAMALMSMPTVVGPTVGPLLGGFITGISSWRWIFWINLPFGCLAIILTLLLIPPIPVSARKAFDSLGFLLSAAGIGAVIFSLDSLNQGLTLPLALLMAAGVIILGGYLHHARRHPAPILDLTLFRYPTFRASLTGGTLFRIGSGALPFMLPLLLQEVCGYSPVQSGAITVASAIGAFGIRTVTRRILDHFGFRRLLIANALVASLSIGLCGAFGPQTLVPLMLAVIFIGGVVRALQFTSINAIGFAEVATEEMSHATTLSQMAQRLSQGLGVALAAGLLHGFAAADGQPGQGAFTAAFVIIAAISALSCLSFQRLPATAGDHLTGRLS